MWLDWECGPQPQASRHFWELYFCSLELTLYPHTLAFQSRCFGGFLAGGEGVVYLKCDLSIGPDPGHAASFWTLPMVLWNQYDFLMGI